MQAAVAAVPSVHNGIQAAYNVPRRLTRYPGAFRHRPPEAYLLCTSCHTVARPCNSPPRGPSSTTGSRAGCASARLGIRAHRGPARWRRAVCPPSVCCLCQPDCGQPCASSTPSRCLPTPVARTAFELIRRQRASSAHRHRSCSIPSWLTCCRD